MPAARDFDNGTSPLHLFGAMLRYYRTRAGLSQEQLGARVYLSGDMIGKIENGQRVPTRQFTEACEAVPDLATNGALLELWDHLKEHLKQRAYPGWFQDWPGAEARAKSLRTFEPLVVPGLLQTEDYARAILRTGVGATDEEIDEMVAARLERQAILDRDRPPLLWAVIDEGALRRPVGGPYVMREQVNHLADAAKRPSIVIQVIPASAGAHEGLRGAGFVIADFSDAPSVAYQDTAVSGQVIESADGIEALNLLWDTLKSEALPRSASLHLMEEAAKTWT